MRVEIYAGDTKEFIFNVLDELGNVMPLNNVLNVKWVLHNRGNVEITKELEQGISIDGEDIYVNIDAGDTALLRGAHTQECRVTTNTGIVATVFVGVVVIIPTHT
jgi:hypothetical protein